MISKMGKKYGERRKGMFKQRINNGIAWGAA
jgi:hypothetical protein